MKGVVFLLQEVLASEEVTAREFLRPKAEIYLAKMARVAQIKPQQVRRWIIYYG